MAESRSGTSAGSLSARPTRPAATIQSQADTILFGLLAALLCVTPFWFGSDTFGAWGFNAAAVGTLVAVHAGISFGSGGFAVPLRSVWPEAVAVALVCVWLVLQVVTGVPEAWAHPVWRMASDVLGRDLSGRISVNPDATIVAGVRLVTAAGVFWLALQLCHSRRRSILLLRILAIAGAAYASYGIYMLLFYPDLLFPSVPKQAYRDSATSTFINRNTYATFAGMIAVLALSVTMVSFREAFATGSRRLRAAGMLSALAGSGGAFALILLIVLASLFQTGSRAGVTASVCGLAMTALLSSLSRGSDRIFRLLLLALLGLILVGTFTFFSELFLVRLERSGSEILLRLPVYRSTWSSILDSPWLGFGYGSFSDVFPMYRDETAESDLWDKAHNTYLELLQGLGLLVAPVLILAAAGLVLRNVLAVFRRHRYPAAAIAAVGCSVVVGLHALVDFSLQIQVVSLIWMAILGAGISPRSSFDRDPGME